jgi:hypothetical protein
VIHYNWHWFWHWGTGELGNNGIHALDVCRWGLQVDYPQSVVCGGGRFHFDDDQETPDTQIVTLNFGDKAINWEHRTWSRRGFEGDSYGVVFYGEEASLVATSSGYKIYDPAGKQTAEGQIQTDDASHIGNFLNCIRDGRRPNAEIEEGVKSTALCHLGNIAYRTGPHRQVRSRCQAHHRRRRAAFPLVPRVPLRLGTGSLTSALTAKCWRQGVLFQEMRIDSPSLIRVLAQLLEVARVLRERLRFGLVVSVWPHSRR